VVVAASGRIIQVLAEDVDLGQAIPEDKRLAAQRECLARAVEVAPGPWAAESAMARGTGLGLLVLDGLLLRRVGRDGRFGAEILGEGDLLRPWQLNGGPATLPFQTAWEVLEPLRLAVLDTSFTERVGRYPQAVAELVDRALSRSRTLAVNMAIVHNPRVEVRLHMLLWHLAERWGRVGKDGVILSKRLTHSVLADLVAARRPSVTTALSRLTMQGAIEPVDRHWRLIGEPPGELQEVVRGVRAGG
jgi:CRP/FNR family transcriptional regulator, cyclic AMP receptor protein